MATLYWPFSTSTVSEWPGQRPGSYHVGTDFAIAQGTQLRATVDGVIKRWDTDGRGAYVLDIIADDGLLVRNGHLSRMDVTTGQRVVAGQVIGLTGGKPGTPGAGQSKGAHLHWELRRDRLWNGGAWIDPRKLNPQPKSFTELENDMTPDENNALMSVYKAVFFGGGDAGAESIIKRLVDIETKIDAGEAGGGLSAEQVRKIFREELNKTKLNG